MSISIIVALAKNLTIGIDNQLPWRCPEDLKRFKALTMGHHMIMGRKTFDSIGRALPGRTTVVVTRDESLSIGGCLIAHSLDEALSLCGGDEEIFIVGGAQIYRQAMDLADTLHVTEIQKDVEGDAHFPKIDPETWREVSRQRHQQSSPEPLEYHFVTYRKS